MLEIQLSEFIIKNKLVNLPRVVKYVEKVIGNIQNISIEIIHSITIFSIINIFREIKTSLIKIENLKTKINQYYKFNFFTKKFQLNILNKDFQRAINLLRLINESQNKLSLELNQLNGKINKFKILSEQKKYSNYKTLYLCEKVFENYEKINRYCEYHIIPLMQNLDQMLEKVVEKNL